MFKLWEAASPFDCETCTDKEKDVRNCLNHKDLVDPAVTEYTPEVVAEHEQKKAIKVFSLKDIRLYECPLSYLTFESGEVTRLAYLIGEGQHLLYVGGWGDQPAWLIEAVEIYRTEQARANAKTGN
jgi:hypothetical protein